MHLTPRAGVSIAELLIFTPSVLAAIVVCARHGFRRSSGWLHTLILCLVRIVGACCQLLTYHDDSAGLVKATIILDSVGVSPLLLATLGLLSRVVDLMNRRPHSFLSVRHFRLIQLLITLGLILSIAGGSSGQPYPSDGGGIKISTSSKVGIILYIAAYAALCFICLLSTENLVQAESGEKRLALVVVLALPFIAVRLAYSALAVFVHDRDFNVVDGSVRFLVGMAVLEEFMVVVMYLVAGFAVEKLTPENLGPLVSRPWTGRR